MKNAFTLASTLFVGLLVGLLPAGCKKNESADSPTAAKPAPAEPTKPAPAATASITDVLTMQTALKDWTPAGLRYKNDVVRSAGWVTAYNRYYIIEGGGAMTVEISHYTNDSQKTAGDYAVFTDLEKAVARSVAGEAKKKEVVDVNGQKVFDVIKSNSPEHAEIDLRAARTVGPNAWTYRVICSPANAAGLNVAAFETRAMDVMKHLLSQNVTQ